MQTYVLSNVLVAVASLDLKAPDRRRERDCLNYPLKSWERRGFPRSRSQASGKDKAGFSRGHNYLKHQIHHVFAQVHLLLPSPQPNVGFTNNVFKINIDGRKIKKSAHTTSSPGLFPQRMGGAPHLFFEGKALGTRLLHTFHRMWQRWLIPFSFNSPGDSPCPKELFQASGILTWKGSNFTTSSISGIWRGREMCHCGLKKDLKELSHTSHGRVKPGADNRSPGKTHENFLV